MDYIQNRPFYTSDPVETVILEEQTVTTINEGYGASQSEWTTVNIQLPQTIQPCLVTFDGVEYECIPFNLEGDSICWGSTLVYGYDLHPGNGEPFIIDYRINSNSIQFTTASNNAGTHTFSIRIIQKEAEIHHLDPKYIKDMYYTDDLIETTIIEGQTVTIDEDGGYVQLNTSITFEVDKTYTVTFNGERYECVAWQLDGVFCIGNGDIYGGMGMGGDEPFSFDSYSDGSVYINVATAGTHTFSISTIQEEIHYLDPKYIKDMYCETKPVKTVLFEDTINEDYFELSNVSIQSGETYIIVFDGTEYECISWYGAGYEVDFTGIGNGNMNDMLPKLGNDEPFVIYGYGTSPDSPVIYTGDDGTHSISIAQMISKVVKIPEKYLPDEVFVGAPGEGQYAEVFNDLNNNDASGKYSHAEGSYTIASGNSSHAEGASNKASGYNSHAEGQYTIASGEDSHAEGNNTIASGEYGSHAEGNRTIASGKHSHAEGSYTIASGEDSHAEGAGESTSIYVTGEAGATTYTLSRKSSSLRAGAVIEYNKKLVTITAYDPDALTITVDNTLNSSSALSSTYMVAYCRGFAIGAWSHSEGISTIASGNGSHAEGSSTEANGRFSHAEGNRTVASGETSHAEGYYTIAAKDNQHVQGKYNIEDTTNQGYAHIVGNGTNKDERSNAHTLDWDGNAWFAGDIYVGSTSGKNKDEGSVKLATIDEMQNRILYENTTVFPHNWYYDRNESIYVADLYDANITERDIAQVTFNSIDIINYGLCQKNATKTGKIQLYSIACPTENITIP